MKRNNRAFWEGIGRIILGLFIVMTMTGCAKSKQGEMGAGHGRTQFISEDYTLPVYNEMNLIRAERGYYCLNGGIRFYDNEAKRWIYLCNKPDCQHKGGRYCVATSYAYSNLQLYNGRLLCHAVEVTDTQFLYHIMEIGLDGSYADVLYTYARVEKAGFQGGMADMVIHRNHAFVLLELIGDFRVDDSNRYSALIVNLENGETTNVDPELFAKENCLRRRLHAVGDCFYYSKTISRKVTELHEYNLVTGEERKCNVSRGYSGMCIERGGKFFYWINNSRNFEIYDPAADTKETLPNDFKREEDRYLEEMMEDSAPGMIVGSAGSSSPLVNEEYICFLEHYFEKEKGAEEQKDFLRLTVYDHQGQKVKAEEILPVTPLDLERVNVSSKYNTTPISDFMTHSELSGNDFYTTVYENDFLVVYHCRFDELMEGKPQFEIIYQREY